MNRKAIRWTRWRAAGLGLLVVFLMWGAWPDPHPQPIEWPPEAIVILGGGNEARSREGFRLATQYPDATLVVTGDGGAVVDQLVALGIPREQIVHETDATSTVENAELTKVLVAGRGVSCAVIVTNWFHSPRALAVFEKVQPDCQWATRFEPKPDPLSPWDLGSQRRERLASLFYLVRYGVWSW